MKFKIDEYVIEKFYEPNEKERNDQLGIVNYFEDEQIKENIRMILTNSNNYYVRYEIAFNDDYVGEITFSGKDELKPEIGIELQEKFRNKGIGYKILKELILRLSEAKNIEYFRYFVRNDNIASIRLVEKLGGVQVKVLKPLEQFELAFYTYQIRPNNVK